MIDKLLQKYGLKYEDLSTAERETLSSWTESLNKAALTVESIKTYIANMRESVELELTKVPNGTKQDTFLKARLRNYMLMESFLTSPEKAKQALERALAGLSIRQ